MAQKTVCRTRSSLVSAEGDEDARLHCGGEVDQLAFCAVGHRYVGREDRDAGGFRRIGVKRAMRAAWTASETASTTRATSNSDPRSIRTATAARRTRTVAI